MNAADAPVMAAIVAIISLLLRLQAVLDDDVVLFVSVL
jgi:hypothetical protein